MLKYFAYKLKSRYFLFLKQTDQKYFYRLLGLRRSGNHALINWLMAQLPGITLLLDNAQRGKQENTANKKWGVRGTKRRNLFVSHEDRELEPFYLEYKERLFGKSQKKVSMLLLRDPYNWMASWYAWQDELGVRFRTDESFREHTISLWKDYAKLYILWENNQDSNQIAINYNLWVSQLGYRKELAEKLELSFSDRGRDKMSKNGKGSSFDGLNFQNKASQLKVLERWCHFENNPVYQSYFDQEIKDLSAQIFPEIRPGF